MLPPRLCRYFKASGLSCRVPWQESTTRRSTRRPPAPLLSKTADASRSRTDSTRDALPKARVQKSGCPSSRRRRLEFGHSSWDRRRPAGLPEQQGSGPAPLGGPCEKRDLRFFPHLLPRRTETYVNVLPTAQRSGHKGRGTIILPLRAQTANLLPLIPLSTK